MQLIPEGALAYTVDQAAHICGLSRHSIYLAAKSGDLKAKRTTPGTDYAPPGGKILILRRNLEAWLENLPDDWWGSATSRRSGRRAAARLGPCTRLATAIASVARVGS